MRVEERWLQNIRTKVTLSPYCIICEAAMKWIDFAEGKLEEMRKENDALRDYFSCKICFSAYSVVAFWPCGHLCCCAVCGSQQESLCPVCRQGVSQKRSRITETKIDSYVSSLKAAVRGILFLPCSPLPGWEDRKPELPGMNDQSKKFALKTVLCTFWWQPNRIALPVQ